MKPAEIKHALSPVNWLIEETYTFNRCMSDYISRDAIHDEARRMEVAVQSENKRMRDALQDLLHHCTTEHGVDRTAFDKAIEEAESVLKGGAHAE